MLIKYPPQGNCLPQKLFFHNNNSSCKCPMGVHHVGIISNFSSKTVVEVDRPMKALTSKKTKKYCPKFSLL